MQLEGFIGAGLGADGSPATVTFDKTKALRTSVGHGQFFDAAIRSNVFAAANPVAGVAPGTTITTTEPFGLYNPVDSAVDLVILHVSMAYISGTDGAGLVAATSYSVGVGANLPPGGTAIVEQCTKLGGARSKGKPLTSITLTAAPLLMFPIFELAAKVAATALQNTTCIWRPDG